VARLIELRHTSSVDVVFLVAAGAQYETVFARSLRCADDSILGRPSTGDACRSWRWCFSVDLERFEGGG
jgi:hypothetical protein